MCGDASLLAQIRQVLNSFYLLVFIICFSMYADFGSCTKYATRVVWEDIQIYEKVLLSLSFLQIFLSLFLVTEQSIQFSCKIWQIHSSYFYVMCMELGDLDYIAFQ